MIEVFGQIRRLGLLGPGVLQGAVLAYYALSLTDSLFWGELEDGSLQTAGVAAMGAARLLFVHGLLSCNYLEERHTTGMTGALFHQLLLLSLGLDEH